MHFANSAMSLFPMPRLTHTLMLTLAPFAGLPGALALAKEDGVAALGIQGGPVLGLW
jgi:hypothetical protein